MSGGRANQVRLIGGRFKRSKLPVADRPGLRPTPDRVRETLFNWLGANLTGWRCVDAFAGSGALGFEAASRGASEVVLVERDADLAARLRSSAQRLGALAVRVEIADALRWMSEVPRPRFDLVLLDPPFDAGVLERALALAAPLVVPGGFVYAEAGAPIGCWPADLVPWREARAGQVHYRLLRRSG